MTKKSISDWLVKTDSSGIEIDLYSGKEYLSMEIENNKIYFRYIKDRHMTPYQQTLNFVKINVSFDELIAMLSLK